MSDATEKKQSGDTNAHLVGLDTLRAAAILMVIPRHAWELLGGEFVGPVLKPVFKAGWIGVELFFVLSGFLIGGQLFQSIKKERRVQLWKFYLKRTFRIMPSYFSVLALYYLWPAFREKPEIDPAWRFIFYVMNYGRQGEAFSHAWSLCIEEHFYLVFPLMVSLCLWRPKVFRAEWLVPMALCCSLSIRFYLWSSGAPFYTSVYRPTHTHLDGLIVGIGLAYLREFKPNIWTRLTAQPNLMLVLSALLIALGLYFPPSHPISYVMSFTLIALGFGSLHAVVLAPNTWLASKKIPGAATMASLAFALYLTHKQMIHLAAEIIGDYKEDRFATIGLSLFFITAMAFSLHFLVEKPFLTLRAKLLKRYF